MKNKFRVKLHHMQDVINLFDTISPVAKLPAICYQNTRYIRWSEFDDMVVYELDFEPYLSIAELCDMYYFTLHKSQQRLYLTHCNDAGHPPPRWEARPITLSQLIDVELMTYLMRDHAYQLGLRINFDLDYQI